MPLAALAFDPCTDIVQPGVGVLEYAPLDEMDLTVWNEAILLPDYNHQASAGVATWYPLPYVSGSGAWTEDEENSEQGTFYRVVVSATLAADTPEVRGQLNAMRRRPYLLRLTRSGTVLLLGSPDNPLRFESRFDSGADGGDSRTHRVAWSGETLRKSPGYVPVF